jgi:phosphatidylserine/phosphatidylglycerophosphate/cardiolipin synthase-like enzyme
MAAMRALTSLLLLLAACAPPPAAPQPASSAIDIHVYFTDPLSEASQTLRGGPDAQLAAAIDRARLSVDMAMYDLNLWSVRDALIAAHQRGVTVRLVVEGDNLAERSELQELLSAGIPVVGDTSRNFMHNKFTVIDGFQVWTGSVNLTISDMYYNRNNLLELQSVDLARNYTTEFQEMFTNGLFGEESPANTPQTEIELGDLRIETYLRPTTARSLASSNSSMQPKPASTCSLSRSLQTRLRMPCSPQPPEASQSRSSWTKIKRSITLAANINAC